MAVFDNLNYSYSEGVSPILAEYYERTILENMRPELVHGRDAQKRTLPLHGGKMIRFHRYTPFEAVTTPLAEGITPQGQTLTVTDMYAMVKSYGRHLETTDELNYYLLDDMHREAAKLLADQAALSVDTVIRDALNAGMNVQYSGTNNVARGTLTTNDILTYADIKKAVRSLKRRNCKPFPDGYYHAIVHPDVVHDLTSDAMWVDVSKYQDKQKTEKYELGTVYKVKFFESTNAKVFHGETYLYDTTASFTAAGAYDTATKSIEVTATLTPDVVRELTGKLVEIGYTLSGATTKTPMCIDHIVAGATTAKIFFRWNPDATIAGNLTTTNSAAIYPQGAGAANADVYSTLIYGADAFGCVELGGNGKNVSVIINPPGSAGALDPISQRGTIAWKVKGFCATILQDDFIVRIESSATA